MCSRKNAAVEVSLSDKEKATSLADGRQTLTAYKTRKDGSGGMVSVDEPNVFGRNACCDWLQFVDGQTCLGCKRPATLIAIYNLTLNRSETAATILAESESDNVRAVDHFSQLKSGQLKRRAKVSSVKNTRVNSRLIRSLRVLNLCA